MRVIGCIILMIMGMSMIGHTEITSPIMGIVFIGIAGYLLFNKG